MQTQNLITALNCFQGDVQRRIREMLSETLQEEFEGQGHPMGEQEMFSRLKQRGVVDNILQQIQFDGGTHSQRPATHFTDKENMLRSVTDKKSITFIYV